MTTVRSPPASLVRPTAVAVAVVTLVLGVAVVLRVQAADRDARQAVPEGAFAGFELDEPLPRPSFTLTTTDNRPFDFGRRTSGKLTLLFFGYTSCPDYCPLQLQALADVLGAPGAATAEVVFVGVDAAIDTPTAIRSYLDRYDRDFVGLSGTAAEVRAAQEDAGVPVAAAAEEDTIGHTTQVIAYTADDLAHVTYPFGVRQQDWADDLERLAEHPIWSVRSEGLAQ